jgi:hypothetical protein
MSQQSFTNGQTSLTVEDFQDILKAENTAYYKPSIDWFTPFAVGLPKYAKNYTGSFYKVGNHASHPIAFSAEKSTNQWGKIYEEAIPPDCRDDGMISLQIYYGTDTQMPNADVEYSANEATWDYSANKALWRHSGRKLRVFLPTAIAASGTLKWSSGYNRLPTVPTVVADSIDAPAEDVAAMISTIKAEMRTT